MHSTQIKLTTAAFGITSALLLAPQLASATTAADIIGVVGGLVNALVPVAFSAMILLFVWGVAMYILNPDKKKGVAILLWGVIGIAVVASLWGIIALLEHTFGVDGAQPIQPNIVQVQNMYR